MRGREKPRKKERGKKNMDLRPTNQQRQIAKELLRVGYLATGENLKKINSYFKNYLKETGEQANKVFIDPSWKKDATINLYSEHGNKYFNISHLEKPTTTKELLNQLIKNNKNDFYNSVSINNFLVGEMTTNKPSKLQELCNQYEKDNFIIDFIAYNPEKYYIFHSFSIEELKTVKSNVSNFAIDNDSRQKENNKARIEATKIFYIISEGDYFKEMTNKKYSRRGSWYWGEKDPNPKTDRITQELLKKRYSVSYKNWHDEHPTKYNCFGYSWQYGETPLDKSNYFMPYFKEQLQRRFAAYKKEQEQKRYNAADKGEIIKPLTDLKNICKNRVVELVANIGTLYNKKSFDDAIKELTNIMCDCDINIDRYNSIDDLKNRVATIQENANKILFFYSVDHIANYKIACLHQYEKIGDHYQMIEKYINDDFWNKYATVIY